MSVIIFIIILGLLVFVHELGHFATAKFFGVRVDEFGMGFPPRAATLFKRGETEYTLNWIPFGGFVKIHGEDPLEHGELDKDYKRSLVARPWWQQVIVLIAGVTMNVLLAWFLFSTAYLIGSPTPASSIDHPERLRNPELTVLQVMADRPADGAGIKTGDRVIRVVTPEAILTNGTQESFIATIQHTKPGETVTITIERGKETRDIVVTPSSDNESGKQQIGVAVDVVGTYRTGFFAAIGEGAKSAWFGTINTFKAFGNFFGEAVQGHASLGTVTGPVGLAGLVGDAQKIGFVYVIMLAAIISINLAVINILPFPALDGGRILFTLIEAVIRRPLPKKFVEWANTAGFFILIGLMLVITVKDVIKLF